MNIFKRLLYCFFASIIVAILLGGMNSAGIAGNEARQGVTLQIMFVAFLCLIQFVLSLTALLNQIDAVRKNLFASAVAFLFLPGVMVAGMIQLFITSDSSRNDFKMFVATIGPSLFYILILIYQFVLFRKTIGHTKINL